MTQFHPGVAMVPISSVTADGTFSDDDELAVEEPLEIVIKAATDQGTIERSLAVTMRTPGADAELAAGFLLTEGFIQRPDDLADMQVVASNVIHVTLDPRRNVDFSRFERHSYVSSSCGVCGKRSIAAVFAQKRFVLPPGSPRISAKIVHSLAAVQRAAQPTFARTGGLHAAALFDADGQLHSLFEDVGRHNAVDKLIGSELLAGRLPLHDKILFLSGRTSFELIQKSAMAGIPIVAAVGAPSSLAVSLARQCSMTLLGFVRDDRFNVYSDASRLTETAPAFCHAGNSLERIVAPDLPDLESVRR
jgi:FdhD protein